jgi:hypothetical protein
MAEAYAADTAGKVAAYNAWMKANFSEETVAVVAGTRTVFAGLGVDQKVGFGLWMASKGELAFT